ncbi:Lrp/AsnC family transcriptional regulator [Candidatus Woesearchaeota archaeon]|nr:Lrp/AsnC family transcriptional regulator [Candidatus Woesearchaeota archaeon]
MVKEKDLAIISHLRKNARESITYISRQIHVPVSTIFDRLRLREEDLIKRYTLLINFEKAGYPVRSNILIKVSALDKERLGSFLKQCCFVNSLYAVDNGFDFLLEGIFRDNAELQRFTQSLEQEFSIIRVMRHQVLQEYKEESFLTDSGKPLYVG